MLDIIRDSTFGQIVRFGSGNRFFKYDEEREGFQVPDQYILSPKKSSSPDSSECSTVVDRKATPGSSSEKEPRSLEAKLDGPATSQELEDPFIVDWYGPDDPENPQNWSFWKKVYVTWSISFLTFSVYIGSAIYTSSIPGIMEEFGVSSVVATLGLSLFVLAYGIGPMIISPLQELPSIGRNPPYIAGLFLFVIFQLPVGFAKNIGTILVFRFFAGFVGSPALATGGASLQDIWPQIKLPYVIGLWSIAAVCGPVFGPVTSSFAAMKAGWEYPIWILSWLSGAAFLFLFFSLPETLASTILLKRARRLRKLTGNPKLTSHGERAQSRLTVGELAYDSFLRPLKLMIEPAIFVLNFYIALVYAIFYLFFESIPLAFEGVYHFNLGLTGLTFLSIIVAAVITFTGYALYNKYHLEPRWARTGGFEPEVRLEMGLFGSVLIPIAIFWFGWGARESVHWIVPVIGLGLYLPGAYLVFQGVFIYLPSSYPDYAASILAGNDLFRSTTAAAFPLFGRALYMRLGLGPGNSLLAGLSILMIPPLYLIMKFGKKLRAKSKYTSAMATPTSTMEIKETV